MGIEAWLRKDRGGNKVRLVDSRQVDVTELVHHSVKITAQKQTEEIIGKVILVDSEGNDIGALLRAFIEAQGVILKE